MNFLNEIMICECGLMLSKRDHLSLCVFLYSGQGRSACTQSAQAGLDGSLGTKPTLDPSKNAARRLGR